MTAYTKATISLILVYYKRNPLSRDKINSYFHSKVGSASHSRTV